MKSLFIKYIDTFKRHYIWIGLKNDILHPVEQFVMCSGRLGFDIIQKALMSGIGMIVGIGAPTSLALDLAREFDITLIGFIKKRNIIFTLVRGASKKGFRRINV